MAEQPPVKRPLRRSGVVVPHEPKFWQYVVAWIIHTIMRLIALTIRFRVVGNPVLPPGPNIYCVWHNRLALILPVYRKFGQKRTGTPGMAAMVSASKDGALMTAVLYMLGVEPVRGSSSRRGPRALLELISWAERGYDLAITPDGPRGPAHRIQEGVMSLAQITGLHIVAASYQLSNKVVLKTWDKFQFPLPFARCEIRVAEVMRVPREATDEERERLRQKLEEQLRAISEPL